MDIANFVSMKSSQGTLIFDYGGKRFEIPYRVVPYAGGTRLDLKDKNGCTQIFYHIDGVWEPLWKEKFSKKFRETIDWVIKQELGEL